MNVQINYIQSNKLNNSLNLKVDSYKGVDNILIDFGVNIINKAYSLFDNINGRVNYITDSFNSTFPDKSGIGKKWHCFIYPICGICGGYSVYTKTLILYSTQNEKVYIVIFEK